MSSPKLFRRYAGLDRRLTSIDLALGVGCPASCVVSTQEGLALT
ncbi:MULTISPECIES: hypothetical protein [unclassified Mesorhizobium]|nr:MULTISPECIES: hypothetical protein [unclassified Mesorhizobium]